MRIRIVHATRYAYRYPARSVLQMLRMTPRDHDGQHVLRWRVDVSAGGHIQAGEDHFGNIVHTFSADGPVEDITITADGEVETTDTAGILRQALETVPVVCFLRETELTFADDEIRAFAQDTAGPDGDPLGRLHRLLGAIHERIRFDVAPTDSQTSASQAFALGRGVCQDLTHIFLACARHLGVPSRYVSGYFHRADGVVDQDAGHAWAEAYVPEIGWIGFDPTNGISGTEAHLRVAIGLDYLGAAPVKGSRIGGGPESLDVSLKVESAARQSQA